MKCDAEKQPRNKHTLALFYYEYVYGKHAYDFLSSFNNFVVDPLVCKKYNVLKKYLVTCEMNRLKKVFVSK